MSDPTWYRDLESGNGDAAELDPSLRAALVETSRTNAREEVEAARQAELARRERERQQAQEARQEAARRSAALSGAIVGAAFRLLPLRLVIAAVLVGLTPVGASFATVSPAGANIVDVVFFPGETGSTAGSGPFTLYAILFWLALGAIATLFLIDLVFGPPRGASFSWPAIGGALAGVAIFIALWAGDSLSGASWAIAPACLAIGYLLSALATGARRHHGPGAPTARELANR